MTLCTQLRNFLVFFASVGYADIWNKDDAILYLTSKKGIPSSPRANPKETSTCAKKEEEEARSPVPFKLLYY
jgi:hypothetical protein